MQLVLFPQKLGFMWFRSTCHPPPLAVRSLITLDFLFCWMQDNVLEQFSVQQAVWNRKSGKEKIKQPAIFQNKTLRFMPDPTSVFFTMGGGRPGIDYMWQVFHLIFHPCWHQWAAAQSLGITYLDVRIFNIVPHINSIKNAFILTEAFWLKTFTE